ncbi:hypothetical protein ACW185_05805 [Limosilactobacillus fermentum]
MLNFHAAEVLYPESKGNPRCLTGTPNWLKKSASRPENIFITAKGDVCPMKMAGSTWGTGSKLGNTMI